jgi:hypothetical protein
MKCTSINNFTEFTKEDFAQIICHTRAGFVHFTEFSKEIALAHNVSVTLYCV